MTLPSLYLLQNTAADVKRDVRRLRWFRRAFLEQMSSVSQETGIVFEVDTSQLGEAFFAWSKDFEEQTPELEEDKRRYVEFAAGLMLRNLIEKSPVHARQGNDVTLAATPAEFWAEGYAYLAFCLNIRDAVLKQTYGEVGTLSETIDELRTWWYFRENVAEDPALAIPFLEQFAGVVPNWVHPDNFWVRRTRPQQSRQGGNLELLCDGDNAVGFSDPAPVADNVLDRSVTHVLLDLDALTNRSDIYVCALAEHMQSYGLQISEREVRARFLDAPLNAAMTYVAMQSGRICPSGFVQAFENRLSDYLQGEIAPRAAVRSVIRELLNAGVGVSVIGGKDAEEASKLTSSLNLASQDLPVLGSGSESFAADLERAAGIVGASSCLLLSSSTDRLSVAQNLGMKTVGFFAVSEQRRCLAATCTGPVIDHFLQFPRPAR